MNQPLHLSLTAALLLPLSFAATSICPPGKTGRVPTAGCAGYADCVNGALSAQYPCTAGTLYDAKSGICNWPANVVCDAEGEEDEEVYDDDDDYTDDRETVDGDELIAKFCPAGFTGKAPTTDCLGYVLCTNGSEGLSAKCPTDSFFNSMTLRCEYGFKDCQLLVTQQQTTAQLSQYAKFCPEAYTGKAPTEGCGGYVKCSAGSVTEVFSCPQGTKFDIMKLACTYADVDCDANKEVEEEEELEEEDDKPVDHSKYCPDDYTGRAPTKNCAGYIDCRKGKVKLVKDCPAGTKFDVMILACTFSEVQCEANVQATYHPTPSPFDGKRDKDDRPERIIADEECPAGFTGNKAINGCKGYIYCAAGTQLGKFACSSGTMFDAATGYCNWSANVNTDVPDCQTSSPSYTPTMSPMNPTASPSYTPTILDMEGEIFYPDYKNGICKNDDKYPPSLSSIYLRASAHGCCTSFFNSAYERCMQAFESESPSMAPSGERSWYPDYDFNLCRSDLNYSPYEANFFASYERCCKFDFLDEAECLMKKPSAMGLIYYPHYPSGTCKNDGRQPLDEVWLYTSKKDCCKNDQVQPYKSCMEGDGAGDMVQNSAGISTSTTTTTTPEVKSWYPDYNNAICLNDGKASEFEVNFFSSYNACCEFGWMDTEKCKANKPIPDSEKWYPIVGKGYCLNNGNPPNKVALSNTPEECCKSFFSSSKKSCVDKSNKRWYPDYNAAHCKDDGNEPQGILMSETYEMCCDRFMSSNKNKCYSASKSFEFSAPPPTKNPTLRPSAKPLSSKTEKPTRQPTKKPNQTMANDPCKNLSQKKCVKDSSCSWKGSSCISKLAQTMAPITNNPTTKPSLRPIQSMDEPSGCLSWKNKKKCAQDDTCRWDSTLDSCISLTETPSGCLSKNKKQCSRDDSCGWNDTLSICMKAPVTEIVTTTTTTTTTTTNSPTHKPTKKPRPEPTHKPSTHPTKVPTSSPVKQAINCGSYIKKNQCTPTSCRWDDTSKKCLSASIVEDTSEPTFSPTFQPTIDDDSSKEMWFPIIAQSRCVLLPSSSPDTDPYETYLECCSNPWIHDRNACIDDAKTQLNPDPPAPNKFYPDYFKGSCQNDGKQPASEKNLYSSLDECCNNEWLDYSRCKQISSNEPPSNNGSNGNKYYPDYFFNVCRNDGNQSPQETYLFDNIEDCCGLEYMEHEGCVYLSN